MWRAASRRKVGLFSIAFNQMDRGARDVGQRAGDHQPGKSGAGAEIDPDFGLRGEVEKLQRIGDMPGPDLRNRGRRDQVHALLPFDQQRHESIEPGGDFT